MKKILTVLLSILFLSLLCGCSKKETISGKLYYSEKVIDPDFGIEVDSPILIREVEMVQYFKNDNGDVEMVFANYPIESFDEKTNPEFPNYVTSEVFHEKLYINGIELSEGVIQNIINSADIPKIQLNDLPKDNGNKFNLVEYNGAYVTASNNWDIGDIRVTFYYLDKDNIYNLTGINNNGIFDAIENSIPMLSN